MLMKQDIAENQQQIGEFSVPSQGQSQLAQDAYTILNTQTNQANGPTNFFGVVVGYNNSAGDQANGFIDAYTIMDNTQSFEQKEKPGLSSSSLSDSDSVELVEAPDSYTVIPGIGNSYTIQVRKEILRTTEGEERREGRRCVREKGLL